MKFAEIEIEAKPAGTEEYEKALRFFTSITPPQPVAQRAADPVRQKFFDMRSLASDRPFARDDSELFYRQAKFMEDFADDFDGDAKFQMYYPYYQHMGYEQLRTYFTWRAKIRRGEMPPAGASYMFLYVYELISCIGVENPPDGLSKLVEVWKLMLKHAPALGKYLPKWLKDYHVYYELPHSFAEFAKEHGMEKYFPDLFMFNKDTDDMLEVWNSLSSYDITESGFYKAGNEQLTADCFRYVVDGIRSFCRGLGVSFESLFVYQSGRSSIWYPFKQALFSPRGRQPDRKVDLLGVEKYQCRNGRWSAYLPIYYSSREKIVGSILRKTESCLRQAVKYKHRLNAAPCEFYRSSGTPLEFDQAIEKAVAEFYRVQTRTVVTVDHKNLERIREEALGTQDKLSVPESMEFGEEFAVTKQTSSPSSSAPMSSSPSPSLQEAQIPPAALGDMAIRTPYADEPDGTETPDSPWSAFNDALTPVEIKALSIVLSGGVNIRAFADENEMMLEVLADGINEKAADYIGDNILEAGDGITVYDEYREQVGELVMNEQAG